MPTGKVKWFSPEKGFGFILLDEETEVFVHYSEIAGDGFRLLHADEVVEFEIVDTSQGFQARNVVRILDEMHLHENAPGVSDNRVVGTG